MRFSNCIHQLRLPSPEKVLGAVISKRDNHVTHAVPDHGNFLMKIR